MIRAYEAMAMRGIIRAVRAAAREAFGAWIVVPAEAESPARRAA